MAVTRNIVPNLRLPELDWARDLDLKNEGKEVNFSELEKRSQQMIDQLPKLFDRFADPTQK